MKQICFDVDNVGCKEGINYLGAPLSVNYPEPSNWCWLVDKFSRIDSWMVRVLSFEGRTESIKSILLSS